METTPNLIMCIGTIFLIVMTAAYFLVGPRIVERKSDHVKLALTFLSAYAILYSVISYVWVWGLILIYFFFPALFGTYLLWPFRKERRNQHIAFFLFWAALASLPMALYLLITLF